MMNTETTPSEAGALQRELRRAKREFDSMTDATLMRRYRETGDEWAFAEVYRRRYEGVFLSCVKFLGSYGMEHGAAFVTGRTMETFRRAGRQDDVGLSALYPLAHRIGKQFLKRHKIRETAS